MPPALAAVLFVVGIVGLFALDRDRQARTSRSLWIPVCWVLFAVGSRAVSQWLGLEEIGYVEPKPGIPPDPQHLSRLIAAMKQDGAKLLLMEDFYNKSVATLVAGKAGAKLLDLPTDVGARPEIKDWFTLVDTVVKTLSSAV